MEVPAKKIRAPKATAKQVIYMIDYMHNHSAFATGKVLGVRGKAANDLQWQNLSDGLNALEGPTKPVEGWKKLWSDQRNQARARAAKARTDLKKTGNTADPITLKDMDKKILSILGGETSVGLLIMEQGFGERPEDTIEPAVILGLNEKIVPIDNVEAADMEHINASIVEYTIVNAEEQEITVMENHETTLAASESASKTIIIDETEPSTSRIRPPMETRKRDADKIMYTKASKKRRLSTSLEEAAEEFKNTQNKHVGGLYAIAESLSRIAAANEIANALNEKTLALYEKTLKVLEKAVEALTKDK